jgi:uncharacterized damage-inducible protein DinB
MNTIVSFFENQVKAEAVITRKFLKIIPEDKYDWKPHPKSMALGVLATHIAELPGWIPLGINTSVLDFAVNEYKPTQVKNNHELQAIFEDNQKKALESLSNSTDEFLQNTWTMRNGDEIYFTITKEELMRMAMSQTIHHRAQLGVFLRLLYIPIPGSYGPSADEMNF